MAGAPHRCDRRCMPVEQRIKTAGNKSLIYPWMRRYVEFGLVNKHVRRDAAATIIARLIAAGATRAVAARQRRARDSSAR
jgi:hypothetical protein